MVLNLNKIINRLLIVSLIWLLLEGVFRKWLLPSLTVQLFAVKYALFGLLYFTYFLYKPTLKKAKHPFQLLILVFILWCLFQLVNNPLKAPLLVTVFGYINYLFFIPVFMIIPHYFTSFNQIEKLINLVAWLSLAIFILGIVQYYLPPDHFLNKLANDEQGFAKVTTFIRSNSIFTFVKNYNSYLLLIVPLFITYVFYRIRHNKSILGYALLILLGMLNMFITASRLPIFLSGIFIVIIFIYILFQISQLRKSIIIISLFSLTSITLLYSISSTFQQSVDGFIYRVNMTEHIADQGVEGYSAEDRITDRLTIFKFSEEAGWLGFGIGTTYQGTGFFLSSKRSDIKFEEEGERIILELGVIGGIIVLLMRLFIFLYGLSCLIKSKSVNSALLQLPFALQLMVPLFFLNSITFSYIDNFIYWFSLGIVIAISNIEEKTQIES